MKNWFIKIDKIFEYIIKFIYCLLIVIALAYFGYKCQQQIFIRNMDQYEKSK